jgi:hypothetical protein
MNVPKARTEHAGELVESSIALVFTLLPMVSSRNRSKIIISSFIHPYRRIPYPQENIYFPPNQDEMPDLAFEASASILRSAASIFFNASFLASLPYCSTLAASMRALSTYRGFELVIAPEGYVGG